MNIATGRSPLAPPSETSSCDSVSADVGIGVVYRSIPISPISISSSSRHGDAELTPPSHSCLTKYELFPFHRLTTQRAKLDKQRVRLEERMNQATDSIRQSPLNVPSGRDGPMVTREHYPSRDGNCAFFYTGPVHSDTHLPHGVGEIEYSNGQVYQGNLEHGLRHGYGESVWRDTSSNEIQVYRGAWENDSRHGRGTHEWFDASDGKRTRLQTATGYWKSGHLHGRVCMVWRDGSTYDGDVINGKKHGRGIQTWKTGKVYSGEYDNGAEEGYGTLTDVAKHTTYRGHFKAGKRHGAGVQMWRNKTYDGQWVHNVIQGHGKLVWKNGPKYMGHFLNGKFHGNGCYTDQDGNKYVGGFSHGEKEDVGKEYFVNGDVYSGAFRQGQRHGYGRLTHGDGSMYAGGWSSGKRSGRGILISTDGKVEHCGIFVDNVPLSADDSSHLRLRDYMKVATPTKRQSRDKLETSSSSAGRIVAVEESGAVQLKFCDATGCVNIFDPSDDEN
ncbi:hypothetical protein MPSEU_000632300 [Mayamaea pseudoterrestris]|nr:hypothetical protein MPSEU_000632300 [Mayamaea pseudoterrestris]